ncbi:MAG: alpha/beta fold hydrolase, partial [Dehalococcoidia bacterium]
MKRRILAALLLAPVVYALMRAAAVDRVHRYETLDADAADLPGMRLYIRGRRMHLTIDGQGPPLLMLHGFGSSSAAFRTLVPHLRSAVTMIAPDLPGWGYSERAPDADHSPKAHATLMIELLDRLSIGRAVVLGYGTGAVIAVHMANTKPDRIAALLLSREEGHDRLLPSWLRPLLTLCVPFLLESRWGQRRLDRSVTALGNRPDEVLVAAHLDEA